MTIYQIDAFAEKVFSGNPAAVIPLNEWPDAELMQKIAMENNLSETVFFVRTNEGYHIRWFTPAFEIDLCGHATLASAFVIKKYIDPSIEVISFSTEKAGWLRVMCNKEMYTLDFPSRMPLPCDAPGILLKSLGLTDAAEILKSRDYFVVLRDEEAVLNVSPDFSLMKELDGIGVIITAKGKSADVVSRCFYPKAGVPEDPATGSAHCNIIPYWSNKLGITSFFAKQLSARGGDLWCELVNDRVMIGGKCVEFMKGSICLKS